MTKRRYKWTLAFKLPRGHKYFRGENGRLAVADYSGGYPHQTDAGVLYVMESEPIVFDREGNAMIPVEDESGERFVVLENPSNALTMASITHMTLANAHGARFRMTPVEDET